MAEEKDKMQEENLATENPDEEQVIEAAEKEVVKEDESRQDKEISKEEKKEKKKKEKADKKQDALKEKIEELEDRVKRQMAEFENFRKRTEKEKTAMFETGAKSVIEKILPVVDNFERGLASVPEEDLDSGFSQGMQMIYKQLMTELENMEVKPIPALDRKSTSLNSSHRQRSRMTSSA